MKRTQIQLDESVFAKLRSIAHARDVSIAQLIRDAVEETYGVGAGKSRVTTMSFIGKGRSARSESSRAVSEDHDAELDRAWEE